MLSKYSVSLRYSEFENSHSLASSVAVTWEISPCVKVMLCTYQGSVGSGILANGAHIF